MSETDQTTITTETITEQPAETATETPAAASGSPELDRIRAKLGLEPKEKPAASAAETAAETAEPAKTEPEPTPEPETVDTAELTAQAKLARADREHQKRVKAWESEKAAHEEALRAKEAELAVLSPLQAARQKVKDSPPGSPERAKALLELAGVELDVSDLAALTEAAGADPKPLTREEALEIARQEIKAQQEAEAKRAEDERKAKQEETSKKEMDLIANAERPDSAAAYYNANAKKFPAIKELGVTAQEISQCMRDGHAATGKLPEWEDVFAYLNLTKTEQIKAKAKALGLVQDPPPPSKTITPDDKRGAPIADTKTEKPVRKSWREERAESLAALKESVKKASRV